MADFNSDFWHWYIVILTIISILACVWLLRWMTTGHKKTDTVEDTGHVWDGDLTELNNPLPRWWLGLFYITIVFSAFYLLLYPGLGTFRGILDWTSEGAYEEEVAAMDAKVGPLFARYQQTSILDLTKDETALKVGERLYANYCTTCHGSDARGARAVILTCAMATGCGAVRPRRSRPPSCRAVRLRCLHGKQCLAVNAVSTRLLSTF